MAISAGSALLATVSTGFTATGFVTAGTMFIGGTMLSHFLVSTAIGAAINALTPKPTTPKAQGYNVTTRGANLDHQIVYGKDRVAGVITSDFLSGEGGAEGTRFLHRIQVMAGHEIESYEEVYIDSRKVTKWKANTAAGPGAVTGITDLTPWLNDPFAVLVPTEIVDIAPDGTETVATDVDYDEYNELAIQFFTGTTDQTASTKLIASIPNSKWTADHRLRGLAYMYVRMGRDAEGSNFPTGVPEVTALIKGRKVYDPREVSHDPADDTTWEWSDNPALCTRDYLTQDFGLGEKDIQVDDDLVEAAANVCDTAAKDGSNFFTCNGAFTTGIQPYDLLNSILSSMGGMLWYAQGQWRMKPAYWTEPVESFDEDDLRSTISVSTRHSRRDNFNIVAGSFRGAENNYSTTAFPEVTNITASNTSVAAGSFTLGDVYVIESLGNTDWNVAAGTTGLTYSVGDSFGAATAGAGTGSAFTTSNAYLNADGGIESSIDLEMPFTNTSSEARRIARIVLERNRQQLTVTATFGLKAFRVQVGDTINLSLERFGWVNKTFEVTNFGFGTVDQYDIQIELTLREITENVFNEEDDGVVFENDNANVPSELAGLTVNNLAATVSGFVGSDGTYVSTILVSWDAIINSNVAEYVVEWGKAAFNFADYGGAVVLGSSPTTREQFIFDGYTNVLGRDPDQLGFDFYNTGGGSGLTEAQFLVQLNNSPEKRLISGSARVDGATNQFTIAPASDDSLYSIRVKAVNDFGTSSAWASVSIATDFDDTVPAAPTGLALTPSIGGMKLAWNAVTTNTDASAANDIFLYGIYRGTSADPTTLIDTTAGTGWSDVGLLGGTTYHYRIRAFDFSGNGSAFSANASATTTADPTSGDPGADGERGPGRWYIDVDGLVTLPTTEGNADNLWNSTTSQHPTAPVEYDQVIFYNGTQSNPTRQQAFICTSVFSATSHTWNEQEELIDGDLLVTGTVTADKMNVGALSAITADLGIVTAGTVNIIDGNRSVLIEPDGALEVLDVAGSGSTTVGRFVQTSSTSSGDVLEIRKEGSSGIGLFVDATNSGNTTGIYVSSDSDTGKGINILMNGGFGGSGDAIYARINHDSGSTGADIGNYGGSGGYVQLALSSNDGGYGVFIPSVSADGGLDSSGGGWSPFTGVHMGMIDNTTTVDVGDILIDGDMVVSTISDGLTKVEPSSSANQAGAIGVLQKKKPDWIVPPAFIDKPATKAAQEAAQGVDVDPVLLDEPDNYSANYDLVDINAVGEGAINVIGENGDISKGDLIVTSSTAGKGMKQADNIVRSHTVAKAREAVTFANASEVKMVACIYLCG